MRVWHPLTLQQSQKVIFFRQYNNMLYHFNRFAHTYYKLSETELFAIRAIQKMCRYNRTYTYCLFTHELQYIKKPINVFIYHIFYTVNSTRLVTGKTSTADDDGTDTARRPATTNEEITHTRIYIYTYDTSIYIYIYI